MKKTKLTYDYEEFYYYEYDEISFIELLNKIYNREELPKIVKYNNDFYYLNEENCDLCMYYTKDNKKNLIIDNKYTNLNIKMKIIDNLEKEVE